MLTLIAFFGLLFLGFPVALTLLAGTIVFILDSDLQVLLSTLPIKLYGAIEQNGLLAIPLFMLLGEVMNRGGLTKRLVSAANVLVGGFRGGLAYVNLLTNAMAASILGSAIAQISVMGKIMIPQMHQRGYSKGFSAAVTAYGGLMGPIIPPSMLMIIYGVLTYQPIAALFVAGILPGILIFLSFTAVIFLVGLFHSLPKEKWQPWKQSAPKLISGLVPGLIPLVVIVGIITGVMTPTESGAVGSIVALFLGLFVYRNIRISEIPEILKSVALSTAIITSLIAAASAFGWVLSFEGVPDRLVEAVLQVTNSALVFLLCINVIIFMLGMFLETISVMIIIVPILLPAVRSLEIDLIHFGVVICLGTVVGLVTPPVGPGLYVAMLQADIPVKEILYWTVPFLMALIGAMVVINVFPVFSVWLPSFCGLV
ncbi:MAG: TRAP transporter large permease [Desulfohalobiaceae bacterium]|nr:TRAP transporter large permease [Desulfohalobiaceae bacterium]